MIDLIDHGGIFKNEGPRGKIKERVLNARQGGIANNNTGLLTEMDTFLTFSSGRIGGGDMRSTVKKYDFVTGALINEKIINETADKFAIWGSSKGFVYGLRAHQDVIVLDFFDNMNFDRISTIVVANHINSSNVQILDVCEGMDGVLFIVQFLHTNELFFVYGKKNGNAVVGRFNVSSGCRTSKLTFFAYNNADFFTLITQDSGLVRTYQITANDIRVTFTNSQLPISVSSDAIFYIWSGQYNYVVWGPNMNEVYRCWGANVAKASAYIKDYLSVIVYANTLGMFSNFSGTTYLLKDTGNKMVADAISGLVSYSNKTNSLNLGWLENATLYNKALGKLVLTKRKDFNAQTTLVSLIEGGSTL